MMTAVVAMSFSRGSHTRSTIRVVDKLADRSVDKEGG